MGTSGVIEVVAVVVIVLVVGVRPIQWGGDVILVPPDPSRCLYVFRGLIINRIRCADDKHKRHNSAI